MKILFQEEREERVKFAHVHVKKRDNLNIRI